MVSTSALNDYVIYTYLRIYCHENELKDESLDTVIQILSDIRNKYVSQSKHLPPFVTDTFASDLKKSLLGEQAQQKGNS